MLELKKIVGWLFTRQLAKEKKREKSRVFVGCVTQHRKCWNRSWSVAPALYNLLAQSSQFDTKSTFWNGIHFHGAIHRKRVKSVSSRRASRKWRILFLSLFLIWPAFLYTVVVVVVHDEEREWDGPVVKSEALEVCNKMEKRRKERGKRSHSYGPSSIFLFHHIYTMDSV